MHEESYDAKNSLSVTFSIQFEPPLQNLSYSLVYTTFFSRHLNGIATLAYAEGGGTVPCTLRCQIFFS